MNHDTLIGHTCNYPFWIIIHWSVSPAIIPFKLWYIKQSHCAIILCESWSTNQCQFTLSIPDHDSPISLTRDYPFWIMILQLVSPPIILFELWFTDQPYLKLSLFNHDTPISNIYLSDNTGLMLPDLEYGTSWHNCQEYPWLVATSLSSKFLLLTDETL